MRPLVFLFSLPPSLFYFFSWGETSTLDTVVTVWHTVPTPDDDDGKGNRSTRRKPAPAPLCPPQIPLDQTRDRTRAAAMGSQRLTA
jgi:hypothetical protein